MVFHYLTWNLGSFSADTALERLGIYGVSIFYVLSGLTLYLVYNHKMKSWPDLRSFFIKRIYRIFPLLWLVTIAACIVSGKMPNLFDLFLNLTGLFGFLEWDVYFSAGIWSIGNELVFYVFFPLFVWTARKTNAPLLVLSVFIFSIYLYFAFITLDPATTLNDQWRNYINPLNQVFLFLSGFLIGKFAKDLRMSLPVSLSFILAGLLVFLFYPASGDTISLVTGVNRLVFTAAAIAICFGFFKMSFKLSDVVHRPLSILGEASYSVYLLHPVVYWIGHWFFSKFADHVYNFPWYSRVVITMITTLVLSVIVYQYFEKHFMRKGAARARVVTEEVLDFEKTS